MPEITQAEMNQFQRYMSIGTPQEVEKKIANLEADNKKYRDERRDAKAEQDGKLLVPEADVRELEQYRELGKIKDVKTRLDEGAEVQGKLRELETRTAAKGFAKAVGLADETVDTMVAIPGLQNATFEVRTKKVQKEDGTEVEQQVGYIKLAGEEKAMSFEDAKEQVPALKGLRLAEPEKPQQRGTNYVKQTGGDGSSGKGDNPYDRIRQEVKEKQEAKLQRAQSTTLEERMGMSRSQ